MTSPLTTPNWGLKYGGDNPLELLAYSDAAFVLMHDKRLSLLETEEKRQGLSIRVSHINERHCTGVEEWEVYITLRFNMRGGI